MKAHPKVDCLDIYLVPLWVVDSAAHWVHCWVVPWDLQSVDPKAGLWGDSTVVKKVHWTAGRMVDLTVDSTVDLTAAHSDVHLADQKAPLSVDLKDDWTAGLTVVRWVGQTE